MGQPYIGEIRMFAGNFAPAGWAFCNGQSIAISEDETLYVLIGTTYGGDGQEKFNLPNLHGRITLHNGNGPDGVNYPIGQMAGTEQETLTIQQLAGHTHTLVAKTSNGTAVNPGGNLLAASVSSVQPFVVDGANVALSPAAIVPAG